jgi:hypothetical protein
MKRNVPIWGFLLGLIFPILGLTILYFIKYSNTPVNKFVSALFEDHKAAAVFLSLSLLANLIPFIYYTNKRLDYTAKGILIATMLYALLIILLRFVW